MTIPSEDNHPPKTLKNVRRISIIPKIPHLKSPEGRNLITLQEIDLNANIRARRSIVLCYAHVQSKLFEPTAASLAKRYVNYSSKNCNDGKDTMCPPNVVDKYAHVSSK